MLTIPLSGKSMKCKRRYKYVVLTSMAAWCITLPMKRFFFPLFLKNQPDRWRPLSFQWPTGGLSGRCCLRQGWIWACETRSSSCCRRTCWRFFWTLAAMLDEEASFREQAARHSASVGRSTSRGWQQVKVNYLKSIRIHSTTDPLTRIQSLFLPLWWWDIIIIDLDSQVKWTFDRVGIKFLKCSVRVISIILHHLTLDSAFS